MQSIPLSLHNPAENYHHQLLLLWSELTVKLWKNCLILSFIECVVGRVEAAATYQEVMRQVPPASLSTTCALSRFC